MMCITTKLESSTHIPGSLRMHLHGSIPGTMTKIFQVQLPQHYFENQKYGKLSVLYLIFTLQHNTPLQDWMVTISDSIVVYTQLHSLESVSGQLLHRPWDMWKHKQAKHYKLQICELSRHAVYPSFVKTT